MTTTPQKTQGQVDYEADVARRPKYHDGMPRKAWADLGDLAKASWERGPSIWNATKERWIIDGEWT